MEKTVTKKALRAFLKNALFETPNLTYGIYDRPGPQDDDSAGEETTVGEETPIDASEHMATQLSVERPPIEDEDYTPESSTELGKAALQIAEMVPDDQVEFFYRFLHKLLDKTVEKHNKDNAPTDDEIEEDPDVPISTGTAAENPVKKEAALRRGVRRILEALTDEEDLAQYRSGSEQPPGMEGLSMRDAAEVMTAPAVTDGMSLETLADEFGFSGAPGIRQAIERLTGRLNYFVTRVEPEDLTKLQDYASGEYIDTLISGELIDPDDIVELEQNPREVLSLDSFRFFFASGFVLPAYQQVEKDTRKRVKDEIAKMGVPPKMEQTIFNQVTGGATRDQAKLEKKLNRETKDSGMSSEQIKQMANNIRSAFPSLKKLAEPAGGLVTIAMDRWRKLTPEKRESVLNQALQQTAEFQATPPPAGGGR